jgi:hypothetical protein
MFLDSEEKKILEYACKIKEKEQACLIDSEKDDNAGAVWKASGNPKLKSDNR